MVSKIRTLLPPKLATSEAAAGAEALSKEIHLGDIATNAEPLRGMQASLTEQGRIS